MNPQSTGRVGVLLGGLSSERELSLATGEFVYEALIERGYDAVKIFADRELDVALRAERIEVAFLALHGRYGEDGCVQGLLELMGIPYTGSSVLASALAMDKLKAKESFRLHNLSTPPYYVHRRGAGSAEEQHGRFGFPAVVKPRAEGSSLGVRLVLDEEELVSAIEAALLFDDDVLVERYCEGLEVHVVLHQKRVLGAIEVVRPRATGIFDWAARRGHSSYGLVTPPRLSHERLSGALRMAERAAEALEADGLLEVDLMVSERGNEYLLEVDTLPALAPDSMVARVARAYGLSPGRLVEEVLAGARLHTHGRAGSHRVRRSPVTSAHAPIERPALASH